MKKTFISLLTFLSYYLSSFAQIPNSPIEINLQPVNLHERANPYGFNQTNGSVKSLINNNGIFFETFVAIDDLNPAYLRFPGGEIGNKYSRYHKDLGFNNVGYGFIPANGQNFTFGTNFSDYYPQYLTSSFTFDDNEKNNIIYPYMKMVNEKFTKKPNTIYVLNLVQHFKDGDQGHDIVGLGHNQIVELTSILNSPDTYEDLMSSNKFTNEFKTGINKNIDGIATLWSNGIEVTQFEYGNEIYANRYSTEDLKAPRIWIKSDNSSLDKYILLCRLYNKIINECKYVIGFGNPNTTFKFSIPSYDIVATNYPTNFTPDPFNSYTNFGSVVFMNYVYSLQDKSFFDAISPHLYVNSDFLGDYNPSSTDLHNALYSGTKSYFNNLYKHFQYLNHKLNDKEIWLTEWNLKIEDPIIHSNLNKTTHLQYLHSFIKTIEKFNKNYDNKISVALYHHSNSTQPVPLDLDKYHLLEISSNKQSYTKMPMYHYFNKVINKINEFNHILKSNPIEDINSLETNLYYQPDFEVNDGSCRASKLLIAYQNNSETSKTLNLNNVTFPSSGEYSFWVNSDYPISHYQIYGTDKTSAITNSSNQYTSIPSSITIPKYSVGYIEIFVKHNDLCGSLYTHNNINNNLEVLIPIISNKDIKTISFRMFLGDNTISNNKKYIINNNVFDLYIKNNIFYYKHALGQVTENELFNASSIYNQWVNITVTLEAVSPGNGKTLPVVNTKIYLNNTEVLNQTLSTRLGYNGLGYKTIFGGILLNQNSTLANTKYDDLRAYDIVLSQIEISNIINNYCILNDQNLVYHFDFNTLYNNLYYQDNQAYGYIDKINLQYAILQREVIDPFFSYCSNDAGNLRKKLIYLESEMYEKKIQNDSVNNINIFPNPIYENKLNFQLNNIKEGKANIIIYNTLGTQIYSNKESISSENQIVFPNRLPAGRYSIRIEQDGQARVGSFIVIQ